MMTTAPQIRLPALGTRERSTVGSELQDTLVELVDLALLGKQLHWCVVGPAFRSVHLYLDEAIDTWQEAADTVAERAVALGVWPDGQATAVVAGSGLNGAHQGPVEDRAVLSHLASALTIVSEQIRTRMTRVGALDPISEDVLVGIVRTLEEQLWMVRAQQTSPSTTTAAGPTVKGLHQAEAAA